MASTVSLTIPLVHSLNSHSIRLRYPWNYEIELAEPTQSGSAGRIKSAQVLKEIIIKFSELGSGRLTVSRNFNKPSNVEGTRIKLSIPKHVDLQPSVILNNDSISAADNSNPDQKMLFEVSDMLRKNNKFSIVFEWNQFVETEISEFLARILESTELVIAND